MHHNGAKVQSCVVQIFCTRGSQSLLPLPGTREKSFSFHFKRYYLRIRAVNFIETFCTCSPTSLGQDLIVQSAIYLFIFGLGFLS
jgi:hypothetical protein